MEVKCYNLLTVNICPIAFNAMKTQVRRIPFVVAFKDTMGKDIQPSVPVDCNTCNELFSLIADGISSRHQFIIECVHMTSQWPCCRSKQRNGGHVGGVKYSFGD